MCSESIQPLCLVEAFVIGNMQMIDSGLIDDKIIAVAVRDPGVNYITNLEEVPQHIFKVLKNYFEQYKVLENKKVEINDFQEKEKAFEIINESIQFYKETYPK
jgi:inorganic pyrophosphatase